MQINLKCTSSVRHLLSVNIFIKLWLKLNQIEFQKGKTFHEYVQMNDVQTKRIFI